MNVSTLERWNVDMPERSNALDLSVIIVNWNTRDLLADCLHSVYDTVHGLAFEVFVVDNASSDGSAAMVRERFPQARLIENAENVGFARANNQAIEQSRGCYVLLLNSDAVLLQGAVDELISHLRMCPDAVATGPAMFNEDGSFQSSYGSLPSFWNEILGPYLFDSLTKPWGRLHKAIHRRSDTRDRPCYVDRVSFACVLIRCETLDTLGALDERYVFYSEDYDWFMRAKLAGYRVLYVPTARAVHRWGGSSRNRPAWSILMLYRSKRLYYAKYYGADGLLFLRIGLTVRFMVKALYSFLASRLIAGFDGNRASLYALLLRDLWKDVPIRLQEDIHVVA